MDYIVINEMSVEGQASSLQHGDALMTEMRNALKALDPICREIFRREDLRNRPLSKERTIYEWLFDRGSRETKDTRDFLKKVLSKGPHLETLLRDVQHACYVGHCDSRQSAHGSGLAGAVHFRAILLSLAESKHFPPGTVTVWYGESEDQLTAEALRRHIVNEADVRTVRRWYEPHSKKHHRGNDEDSHHAPMDLKDEIAQRVLDQAVSVPGEKRVVGLHEGRFYVFHPHRIEANTYHGFLMAEGEVEQKFPRHHQLLRSNRSS